MGRLFVLLFLLLLLAFVPVRFARGSNDVPVFFSLLFPDLMPAEADFAWLSEWLDGFTGEAKLL